MQSLKDFSLRVVRSARASKGNNGLMSIIIRREYRHLKNELFSTFKDQNDVQVVVDRRYDERRKREQSVPLERRTADRRRPTEKIMEIILSP